MTKTKASARAARRRSTFRQTTKPNDPRHRLIALLAIFVIIGAGFVAVLVDLQTVRPDRYRDYGENQRTRTRQIAGYRGAVVDRNDFVLAASTPSHQIVTDPTLVEDPEATAALLAPILGVEASELAEILRGSSPTDRYGLLARNVDDEAVTRIQQLDAADEQSDFLNGIFIRPEENRVYPAGELAKPIVGRVDLDEQGTFGLEHQYNDLMTGVPGTEQFERGRFGSISVGDWKVDPATAGYDVQLTLDHRIQYVAEQALLEHCEATGAQGATAVMAEPHSGEILAMVSVVRDDDDGCIIPIYNTALINTFEPGSVVKPFVIAAATEELSYTADTLVDVPNGIVVGGKGFYDHPEHPPAPFPISQILADSMNVGTIKVAQRLSADTVYDYFTDFGIGQASGLGVKGESSGRLRAPADWWGADYGSIPIGQGMTVNATQLLSAYNVLANGGTFVDPVLVRSVESADGQIHSAAIVEPRQVISQRTVDELKRSLAGVVEQGTGSNASVPGYSVAGKTGTAWKVFDDGSGTLGYGSDGNRRYIVTFAGFLPVDEPMLSLVVVVDEPLTDNTAAAVAAPIFSEIADYAVRILGIAPTEGIVGDGERVRGTPALADYPPFGVDSLNVAADPDLPAANLPAPAPAPAAPAAQEGEPTR